jgi:hypothetical protein
MPRIRRRTYVIVCSLRRTPKYVKLFAASFCRQPKPHATMYCSLLAYAVHVICHMSYVTLFAICKLPYTACIRTLQRATSVCTRYWYQLSLHVVFFVVSENLTHARYIIPRNFVCRQRRTSCSLFCTFIVRKT